GGQNAQLTIASLMSISHIVLPTALVAVRKSSPRIFVHIRENVGSTVVEDVRNAVVDFGLGSPGPGQSGIATESIMRESCFVILPAGHELCAREMLDLPDLRGVPLISMPPESGLRRIVDAAAAQAGIELNHAVVTQQYS